LATHKSEVYKVQEGNSSQLAAPTEVGGRSYWALADIGGVAWAARDKIKLFRLPANAIVMLLSLRNEAFGSGVSVDIGSDDDGDMLVDGHSVASAGQQLQVPHKFEKVGGSGDITLTFSNHNPTDDARIHVGVQYVIGAA